MIQHEIKGSLQQWTKKDEKVKNGPDIWRGYIVAKMFYNSEDRMKFPFLVFRSCRNLDDRWMQCIYLNAEGNWQGQFCMMPDEETANRLIGSLKKPEFKNFVECLAPLVPEDFKMPKSKRGKTNKDEKARNEVGELFAGTAENDPGNASALEET